MRLSSWVQAYLEKTITLVLPSAIMTLESFKPSSEKVWGYSFPPRQARRLQTL